MRTVVLLVAFFIGFTTLASAEDIATAQSVIRSQDEAIGRDDAAAAYAFAAPGIKGIFRNPEAFMSMVRNGYFSRLPSQKLRIWKRHYCGRKDRAGCPHCRCRRRGLGGALHIGAAIRRQFEDQRMLSAEAGRSLIAQRSCDELTPP